MWLVTSPDVANVSGEYFFDQEQKPPSPEARDTETAGRLWEISERQCAVSREAPKPAHDFAQQSRRVKTVFEIVGFVVAGAASWFGTAVLGRPIRHYLRFVW